MQKFGYSQQQIEATEAKLNLIFENTEKSNDLDFFVNKLLEKLCDHDSNKTMIYRLVDSQFNETKKNNYIKNIISFNLGEDLSQKELSDSITNYIKLLDFKKDDFVSNIKSLLNSNIINYGVCTKSGDFYPLYSDSGFKSHDEIIEYLLSKKLTTDTMFLEIGSKVSTAGNKFPIIRVQDITDTNNNISDSLKNYIVSKQMVYAIHNIFENNSSEGLLFEQFLIKNLKNIGFNSFENKKNLQTNIYQFSKYLDRRQFDAKYMNDLIESQNDSDEILRY